jgi:5-methylcytosine-specific restriction endonuclease McrA
MRKYMLPILEERPISDIHTPEFNNHHRLKVFHQKGCACSHPGCDKVGTRLVKRRDGGGGIHWDVFTADNTMMTIDHHIPKSKGGTNVISNLFPMCAPHNHKKSNKMPNINLIV